LPFIGWVAVDLKVIKVFKFVAVVVVGAIGERYGKRLIKIGGS